jgi:hypothetical protein
MDFIWPLCTTILMFLSFWIGRFFGFKDGWGVGYDEGAAATVPVVAKAVLNWVRIDKDVNLSDPEITEVCQNITLEILE